jgi:4-carboxymuconolactone decarboxylase
VASRKKVEGPFSVLTHSPDLAARIADVGAYVRFESDLPIACRCLAALVVARHFECRYEWGAWAPQAEAAGIPLDAIEAIRTGQRPDGLSDGQALVVTFGRELLEPPHRLTEPTFEGAVEHFGVRGAVELSACLGYLAMLAFTLNGFEVAPHDGAPELFV